MDQGQFMPEAHRNGFFRFGVVNPLGYTHLRTGTGLMEAFPWVRSAVVLAYPSPDPLMDYDIGFRLPEDAPQFNVWIYNILYGRAGKLAQMLIENGYRACVDMAAFDLRRAAVEGGVGSLGKNWLVLTPELGPRVRLIGLLTDLALPFTDRFTQDLCLPECHACERNCPGQALNGREYDADRCRPHFRGEQISDLVWCTCAECMHSCPVGMKQTRNLEYYDHIKRTGPTRDG
jgi:epoxyqueuosine reductase QueG